MITTVSRKSTDADRGVADSSPYSIGRIGQCMDQSQPEMDGMVSLTSVVGMGRNTTHNQASRWDKGCRGLVEWKSVFTM